MRAIVLVAAHLRLSAALTTGPVGVNAALLSLPIGAEVEGFRSTHAFTAERISARPAVFVLRNFLLPEECEVLVAAALESGELSPAETSGGTDARKRCDVCFLDGAAPVVGALTREVAHLLLDADALTLPGTGSELLNVLRYEENGEFLPHYDATASPRVLTVLYYLNGNGATWFPLAVEDDSIDDSIDESAGGVNSRVTSRAAAMELAAALEPHRDGCVFEAHSAGDALAFFNFDERGAAEARALHAGLPVAEGETKWVASHFFQVPALVAPRETRAMETRARRMKYVGEETARRAAAAAA